MRSIKTSTLRNSIDGSSIDGNTIAVNDASHAAAGQTASLSFELGGATLSATVARPIENDPRIRPGAGVQPNHHHAIVNDGQVLDHTTTIGQETDDAPRSSNPGPGVGHLDNPYVGTVVLNDLGTTPDGGEIPKLIPFVEARSLDTATPAVGSAQPISIASCIPIDTTDASCDGVDDDCDGTPDDEFVGESTTCGDGVCEASGVMICVAGDPVEDCEPGEPLDLFDANCDGVDDNCDGTPDDGFESDISCYLPGACAAGNVPSSCDGIAETPCQTGTPASADLTCDGIDEDCDNELDEDANVATACGSGACASTGTRVCANTVLGPDSCVAGLPTIELCDNVDNDCDDQVDEAIDSFDLGAISDEARWLNVVTCGDYLGTTSVDGAVAIGGELGLDQPFSIGFRAPLGDLDSHQPGADEPLNIAYADHIAYGPDSQGELYGNVITRTAPAQPSQVTIVEGGLPIVDAALDTELTGLCADITMRSDFICRAEGALGLARTDAPIPSSGWWGSYDVAVYKDGTNFYEIDAQSIDGATAFIINNEAGFAANVVVNVVGPDDLITLSNGEVKLNGIGPEQILFSFCDIDQLEIAPDDSSGFHFYGTILAPRTDVLFENGEIFGTLAVKSLTGRGTVRLAQFTEPLDLTIPTCISGP